MSCGYVLCSPMTKWPTEPGSVSISLVLAFRSLMASTANALSDLRVTLHLHPIHYTLVPHPYTLHPRPADEAKRDALVVKILMRQLFVALKQLHGIGVVHRDIKPASAEPSSCCPLGSIVVDHHSKSMMLSECIRNRESKM